MDTMVLDANRWAVENFGECDFGDQRLTDRIVRYAEACSVRPDDGTPQQTQEWGQCKAAYRFMNNEKVTFQKIIEPHCRRTRNRLKPGAYLSICDTTQLSYSLKRKIKALGPVGDNIGQGFLLHTSLIVREDSEEIIGMGAQELFYRSPKPKGESSAERKKRERESEVWGRIVENVGPSPDGVTVIHVCDRGADDFELYCHCLQTRSGWVVRAQQLKRKILPLDLKSLDAPNTKQKVQLNDYLQEQGTELGAYQLSIRANKKQPARVTEVSVRCAPIWMPRPTTTSPWVKTNGPRWIPMSVVEVVEKKPKRGVAPIRWVLLTHEIVRTYDECWKVIGRYEKRPIIEEFHKSAKTGTAMEDRLYRTNKRLERITGILSVLAVRIVQMKTIAKKTPDRPAHEIAPRKWILVVCKIHRERSPKNRCKWNPRTLTIENFLRGVAMLGGFLGRKSDGLPGWITLWRGVKELQITLRGLRLRRAQK
jgi:hypothetical protein